MMDWTDRHCRFFHRLLSPGARLYTEMVTAQAVIHGPRERLLSYTAQEHPIALQLGGSDPAQLGEAAKIAAPYGYDEVNLNCGCPSDRVQSGKFGACLMAEPQLVADCLGAMRDQSPTAPVTVKCRVGIDDADERDMLFGFVESLSKAGTDVFIIHARKAWLKGLSPKENREIPPLNYDLAAEVKRAYPHLTVVLNGGLDTVEKATEWADRLDGVMIGRAAYHTPEILAAMDNALFNRDTQVDMGQVLHHMAGYAEDARTTLGTPPFAIYRHMLGLFGGVKGARGWRRHLSENGPGANDPTALLRGAAESVGILL